MTSTEERARARAARPNLAHANSQSRRVPLTHIPGLCHTGSSEASDASRSCGLPLPVPTTLHETGLSVIQLADLLLKHLFLHGRLSSAGLSGTAGLSFRVLEPALQHLKFQHFIELVSGESSGTAAYCFELTETGRARARHAFEQSGYAGPAPVTIAHYREACSRQSLIRQVIDKDAMRARLSRLVIPEQLIDLLGAAACGAHSMMLFGAIGNGKTAIAESMGELIRNDTDPIAVPYAIQAGDTTLSVFDPTIHVPATNAAGSHNLADSAGEEPAVPDSADHRWRLCKRPFVVCEPSGFTSESAFAVPAGAGVSQVPLVVRANGGLFVVDDFGRMCNADRSAANAWIDLLQEREVRIGCGSSRVARVPADAFLAFTVDEEPVMSFDDGFLRRVRHKLPVSGPSRAEFAEILRGTARREGFTVESAAIDELFTSVYCDWRRPRAADPRELIEIARTICRFQKCDPILTVPLIRQAAAACFGLASDSFEAGVE